MKATQVCSIDDCSKPVAGRGWCGKHYSRWKRHGDPLKALKPRYESAEARLAALRDELPNGCIVYTGPLESNGYGRMRYRGRAESAHRIAWELANGPIPPGMTIDHVCHNKACFNVAHLRLATPQENSENHSGQPGRPVTASGHRGVHRHVKGYWVARVNSGGRVVYNQRFDNIEDAAEAARLARLRFFTHNDADRVAG